MAGLFQTIDLGARSLQTQQQGLHVTGQNLANANNSAFARQRLEIQTSCAITTPIGPLGTGANAVGIVQVRSALIDAQVRAETGAGAYWQELQSNLESAREALGQTLGLNSEETAGLAGALTGFFNSWQDLSANPSSQTARMTVIQQASDLASRFNEADQRLSRLADQLDDHMAGEVGRANLLLTGIADLNEQIWQAEAGFPTGSAANDLRDLRQSKIEELTSLIPVDVGSEPNGTLTVSVGGNVLVSNNQLLDTLQVYAAADGDQRIETAGSKSPLDPSAGSIGADLQARDRHLASIRDDVDNLASTLINGVNTAHEAGFNLAGNNGLNFFAGTGASDIAVRVELMRDPSLLQVSSDPGASGNGQVALEIAALADQRLAALGGQTIMEKYLQTVVGLGESLSEATQRASDQSAVLDLITARRESVSGVSVDEETANLIKFQKVFEASARLVSTLDEMLDTVLNMKR